MVANATREAILKVAKQSLLDREISRKDYFLVRLVSHSDRFQGEWRRIEEQVEEMATLPPSIFADLPRDEAAPVAAAGTIDWEALAAFLKEILPLVLDFIKQLLNILPAPTDLSID